MEVKLGEEGGVSVLREGVGEGVEEGGAPPCDGCPSAASHGGDSW